MPFQGVLTTLANGQEQLDLKTLLWKHPASDITNGTLLTVESNHFAVYKSRGAILNIYETGQYTLSTPEHPLFGSFQKAVFGGQNPWQYEVLFVNRSKLVCSFEGTAFSKELASLKYQVDYYIHVDNTQDVLKLIQHMPLSGHVINIKEINAYSQPVVEQSINQICQVTPFEQINEKIHDLSDLVHNHLEEFLGNYGIKLDTVKVLVYPASPMLQELMTLKAFGLSEQEATRFFLAEQAVKSGNPSAANILSGDPYYNTYLNSTNPVNLAVDPTKAAK
jgi:membrane protease subunit (stomatin/prohibitin family)